jgi:FkbM family methyltransferase
MALEPHPMLFRQLLNITWGARVAALNLAASDRSDLMSLSAPYDADHGPCLLAASLVPRPGRTTAESKEVRLVRLDDIIGRSFPVSLMKIDVEGHEMEVLAGATQTIEEHHPALVIEVEQRHLPNGRNVSGVIEPLLDAGYECQCIGRGRHLFPWSEFDLESDQLRWLTQSGGVHNEDLPRYANNFVLTWRKATHF